MKPLFTTTQSSSMPEAQVNHPRWGEWAQLPAPVKDECGSFLRFLAIREQGLLPGLIDSLEQQATKDMLGKARYDEGRAFEKSVERAPADDPERWETAKTLLAERKEYPVLNRKG